jgi:putative oxidoreductase
MDRRVDGPRVILRVLRVVMALIYLGAGGAKLAGLPAMVQLFAAIGLGQWLRYAVGSLEVLGGVGLLVPSLAGAAALGLCTLMIGATMTQVVVCHRPPLLSLASFAALVAIAWGHRDETHRLMRRLTRSVRA